MLKTVAYRSNFRSLALQSFPLGTPVLCSDGDLRCLAHIYLLFWGSFALCIRHSILRESHAEGLRCIIELLEFICFMHMEAVSRLFHPLAVNRSAGRRFVSGGADDEHDDFKPKFKDTPSASADDAIKADLSENKVMLYMKVSSCMPIVAGSQPAWSSVVGMLSYARIDTSTASIVSCRGIRQRQCAGSATWPAKYSTPTVCFPPETLFDADKLLDWLDIACI